MADAKKQPNILAREGMMFTDSYGEQSFERADVTSNTYWDWYLHKAYMLLAAQAIVGEFMQTFKEFPPRQKAASFTIDQAHDKLAVAGGGR